MDITMWKLLILGIIGFSRGQSLVSQKISVIDDGNDTALIIEDNSTSILTSSTADASSPSFVDDSFSSNNFSDDNHFIEAETSSPDPVLDGNDEFLEGATTSDGLNDLNLDSYVGAGTTEKELLYLEFEFEGVEREGFWKDNPYECRNGTLIPSSYLRRKYWECRVVHNRFNPKCIRNCESAITKLLGEDRIPHIELYTEFFKIVLPETLQNAAVAHFQNCFDNFGHDEKAFLDYSCEGPQQFYSCTNEFKQLMVC